MEIKGFEDVKRRLERELKEMPEDAAAGLLDGAWDVVAESQERTPVKTGTLKASQDAIRRGETVFIRVRQNYATVVHEDLDAYHKHGQAKFLESAARDKAGTVIEKVLARAKR